jgi:hypothetical protein
MLCAGMGWTFRTFKRVPGTLAQAQKSYPKDYRLVRVAVVIPGS